MNMDGRVNLPLTLNNTCLLQALDEAKLAQVEEKKADALEVAAQANQEAEAPEEAKGPEVCIVLQKFK